MTTETRGAEARVDVRTFLIADVRHTSFTQTHGDAAAARLARAFAEIASRGAKPTAAT